jgi:AcrR family transcriptional regulator
MAHLLTRREKQEQTRDRLLEAAARVFARRGYGQASVEEIAAEAGYTTGAVYSNFSGKEELFLALADKHVEHRITDIRAVAEAARRGDEPGAEAAEQFREFLERDPDWPVLFYEFWSFGVRNAKLREEFGKRREALRDALAETLERVARELGFRLRFSAPVLATAINASLSGLAFERAANPDAIPDEVFAEFIAAVLACAVAAPEDEADPARPTARTPR